MCLPVADRGDGDQVSTSSDGNVWTIKALAGTARPRGPAPDEGRCDRQGNEGAEAQDRQHHHSPARLGPPPALHTVVTEDVRSWISMRLWENRIQEVSLLSLGTALAGLGAYLSTSPQLTGDLGVTATSLILIFLVELHFEIILFNVRVLCVGGVRWFNSTNLKDAEE